MIEQGSALDADYLRSMGQFDVVYSWGVLHHTGEMWRACELVAPLVVEGGYLWLAIYNDQDYVSHWWRRVKLLYHGYPALRPLLLTGTWVALYGREFLVASATSLFWLFTGKNPVAPLRAWYRRTFGQQERGMEKWTNLADWVGGYPFEVAPPGEIFAFYRDRSFTLTHLATTTGHGCNELVFKHQR